MIPDRAFYIEPDTISGQSFSLNKTESNHAIRVLRMSNGDDIALLDGKGMGYHGIIQSTNKIVKGEILEHFPNLGENDFNIILAPALIKRDRFESMLEKATELGVAEIFPILMDRSVKNKLNLERSTKIIHAAAKQSMRSRFPKILEPKPLNEILTQNGQIVCAMIGETSTISKLNLNNIEPVFVIVGPEGDFTESEIELMKNANVQFYNLGQRRLRSETAALNSLSILNELLNR